MLAVSPVQHRKIMLKSMFYTSFASIVREGFDRNKANRFYKTFMTESKLPDFVVGLRDKSNPNSFIGFDYAPDTKTLNTIVDFHAKTHNDSCPFVSLQYVAEGFNIYLIQITPPTNRSKYLVMFVDQQSHT